MNEARAPTDEKIRAQVLADYKRGVGPKALAEETGISINTIKSWIKRDKNRVVKKNNAAAKKEMGAPSKKKTGAPLGNKNAAGHGAPIGNQNATKHGAYSGVYWDFLQDDERDIEIPEDEEAMLIEQILFFSIRERRIMKAINKYMGEKSGQYICGAMKTEDKRSFCDGVEKRQYEIAVAAKVRNGDRLPGEAYNQITNTAATIDLIIRLEKELTAVQSKKTKAIAELAKVRGTKQAKDEINIENKNDETPVVLYMPSNGRDTDWE